MGFTATANPDQPPIPRWWRPLALAALALAGLALIGERGWLAATQPLWLDETWTAAIVSAPGVHGFWREVYLDVNAPLYYLFMRLWSQIFGLSDLALRIPGLIFAPLAAALLFFSKPDDLPAQTRRGWAALLFFWWGCGQFLDARCYGLLLLICAAQALAFGRLLRTPSSGGALAWCAISALAILCQYYALFIGLAQGLVYLAVHRRRAVRTWPGLLGLIPAALWIAVHAPRIAQYGRADVAWHPAVDAGGALALASFTISAYSPWLSLVVLAVLALAAFWPRPAPGEAEPVAAPSPDPAWAWQVAAAGVLALVMMLLSGVLKPSLTARYLMPLTPSMLLGVVLCAGSTRRQAVTLAALVCAYALFALDPGNLVERTRLGAPYGDEAASRFLMSQGVTDVTFLWDHPAAKIMDPNSLIGIGGFFFRRAGAKVVIRPLIVGETEDANRRLLDMAQGRRPGLIWIFDRTGRSAARAYPPRIAENDARWTCKTYGDGVIGAVACVRAASVVHSTT